eukprot:TRINITY_DN77678_c0_g1_i1.p1 TRINITY_DN77678_c0_g1~~TRINITY_DN77678_c0_g1_i1.p1  ORF type:complete len:581 (-),score=81.42 TRINITY_DN77678_c0_g1_i1:414-2156(-)
MGQQESDLAGALDEVDKNHQQENGSQDDNRVRMYKLVEGTKAGRWELVTNNLFWKFWNFNQGEEDKKPIWMLEIEQAQIDVKVDQDLDFNFDYNVYRVTFTACGKLWAMYFPREAQQRLFHDAYMNRLFENMCALDPNEEESRTKMFGDYGDLFLRNTNIPTPTSKHVLGYMDWEEVEDDNEDTRQVSSNYKEQGNTVQGSPIQQIKVGGGANSYLVKGMQIDVIKNQIGDIDLSFDLKIPGQSNSGQKKKSEDMYIDPKELILLEGESTMGIISQQKRTKVYQTDIETQKVVAEWGFQKDGVEVPIAKLATDSKAAQLSHETTFLGLDKSRLARWDMRDPHGVVQDLTSQLSQPVVQYMHGKDYSGNPDFCCMSTSGDGFVVVGARDGQIRLYNNKTEKSLNRASTSIPGLGKPITAVDVTYDGKWIVATTDQYLMVVKTTFVDKKNKETNGFASRMGKEAPMPRLLKLKAEDIARVKQKPFHDAKFTWITEQGTSERWIVASCGNFTVLWNFRSVKLDQPKSISMGLLTVTDHYHLIPKEGAIVDSVFMHEKYSANKDQNEPSLLVATDHDIWMLQNT